MNTFEKLILWMLSPAIALEDLLIESGRITNHQERMLFWMVMPIAVIELLMFGFLIGFYSAEALLK